MSHFRRALVACTVALAASGTLPSSALAQRNDSYTWKLGLQAGSMILQTRTQDSELIPSAGAHVLIMGRRGGLLAGVDEAFGSDEKSGLIVFNDVRRYQAVLMAFPVAAPLEPYFGVGGGIMQVVSPRVDASVQDPFQREALLDAAKDASASGFLTALAGIQGRWNRFTAFGQAQIHTAPGDDKLLRGASYSVHGGIRIGLGSAKEGVKAGGY
jgi:hypothetical protein